MHTIAHSFLSVEIKHLNFITDSQLHVLVTSCTHVIEERAQGEKNASNQFLIPQLLVLNVQHTVPDMVVSINCGIKH